MSKCGSSPSNTSGESDFLTLVKFCAGFSVCSEPDREMKVIYLLNPNQCVETPICLDTGLNWSHGHGRVDLLCEVWDSLLISIKGKT